MSESQNDNKPKDPEAIVPSEDTTNPNRTTVADGAKDPTFTNSQPKTTLFNSETPDQSTSEQAVSEDESSPINESNQSLTWTVSSESHSYEKSSSWYLILAVVTVIVAGILYLLTKSIITPVVIVVCGIIAGFYSKRQLPQLDYLINSQGIRIGSKQYRYDHFRLFIITTGLPFPELTLIPVKRFMPSISVRYSSEVEKKLLDILSQHLPYEERRPDFIDALMHRVHF